MARSFAARRAEAIAQEQARVAYQRNAPDKQPGRVSRLPPEGYAPRAPQPFDLAALGPGREQSLARDYWRDDGNPLPSDEQARRIQAAEREACAALAAEMHSGQGHSRAEREAGEDIAAAIRARGG